MSSAPAPEFMGAGRGRAHISAVSGVHGWDALSKFSIRRIEVPMAPPISSVADGRRCRFRNELAQYDLDHYAVAIASFGGMVALVPKRRTVTLSTSSLSSLASGRGNDAATGDSGGGSHIHIFNGAGVECGRGPFPLNAELAPDESAVFWSQQDKLCCMLVDGALLSYNVHGIGPLVTRILPEFGGDTVRMIRTVRNRGEAHENDSHGGYAGGNGGHYFGGNGETSPSSQSQLCADHGFTGVVILTKHGRLIYVEDVALGTEDGNIVDLGGRDAAGLPPPDDTLSDDETMSRRRGSGGFDAPALPTSRGAASGGSYFADSGSRRVLTFAVCSSDQSASSGVEVLVAMSNSTILRVDRYNIVDHCMQAQLTDEKGNGGPVMRIAVAPNGRFIACYTSGGRLKVFNSSSLDKALLDFDTKSAAEPRQMVWAGVDAVVLHWRQFGLLAVGPYMHWIHYPYDTPLVLSQEVDSCRIVTATTCEILQRVPDVTVKTFEMGSTEPSALLFAAMQAFHNQEAKADEDIRSIVNSNQLGEAMRDLLDAARAEWDMNGRRGQKRLLAAVSYGSGFHIDMRQFKGGGVGAGGTGAGGDDANVSGEGLESEGEDGLDLNLRPFVSQSQVLSLVCRQLRVLNGLRHFKVGLPMTYGMFEELGAKRVVDRLIDRHMHQLAVKVCAYLHLDPRPVMIHWACAKVLSVREDEMNDVMLHRVLLSKLGPHKNVSYRKIAQTAAKAGRNQLAALLLDAEPIARVKVHTLLDLNQLEQALERAVKSRDPNLIYRAIFAIQNDARARAAGEGTAAAVLLKSKGKTIDEEWFPKVLRQKKACDLLLVFLKKQVASEQRHSKSSGSNPAISNKFQTGAADLLSKLFFHLQWYAAAGNFMVNRAYRYQNIDERVKKLGIAVSVYKMGLSSKVTQRADKDSLKFHCKSLEDQMRLLQLQLELEEATGETNMFLDLSLMHTIAQCIKNGSIPCLRVAQKLRKEFDVSERQWYHVKIRVLAKCQAWGELKRFAEEKRSPVGYGPFADAYIRGGKPKDAAAMIALIKSEEERLNKLEDNKQWIEAALLASKMGELQRVKEIYNECGSPAIQEEVQVLARKVGIQL